MKILVKEHQFSKKKKQGYYVDLNQTKIVAFSWLFTTSYEPIIKKFTKRIYDSEILISRLTLSDVIQTTIRPKIN
jgi:hypothetical protein